MAWSANQLIVGDRKYYFGMSETLTTAEAEASCAAKGSMGLAVFEDAEEWLTIRSILHQLLQQGSVMLKIGVMNISYDICSINPILIYSLAQRHH